MNIKLLRRIQKFISRIVNNKWFGPGMCLAGAVLSALLHNWYAMVWALIAGMFYFVAGMQRENADRAIAIARAALEGWQETLNNYKTIVGRQIK